MLVCWVEVFQQNQYNQSLFKDNNKFIAQDNPMSETQTGTVKWFNDAKGFGFIQQDNSDTELFAHYSEISSSGFKSLKEGQRVSFTVTQGKKGEQASNITAI